MYNSLLRITIIVTHNNIVVTLRDSECLRLLNYVTHVIYLFVFVKLCPVDGAAGMSLEEFIKKFPPPQYAKVTEGYYDLICPDYDFSTNDLIKVIHPEQSVIIYLDSGVKTFHEDKFS